MLPIILSSVAFPCALRRFRSQHCLFDTGSEIVKLVSRIKESIAPETCLMTQLRNKTGKNISEKYVLVTEIDIGPTHDPFTVWLHSLNCRRGTSKDADELPVIGHRWCTKNYSDDASVGEQNIAQAFGVLPGHLHHLGVSISLWRRVLESEDIFEEQG